MSDLSHFTRLRERRMRACRVPRNDTACTPIFLLSRLSNCCCLHVCAPPPPPLMDTLESFMTTQDHASSTLADSRRERQRVTAHIVGWAAAEHQITCSPQNTFRVPCFPLRSPLSPSLSLPRERAKNTEDEAKEESSSVCDPLQPGSLRQMLRQTYLFRCCLWYLGVF